MVNPKRVVFDGSKRTETVTLFNSGKDTATYAISMVDYTMNTEGKFDEVPMDSAHNSAQKIVKFFPKQVTLAPGSSQAIRVQVNKPQGLEKGEYRSHIYFRGIGRVKAIDAKQEDTISAIAVSLRPIFGISIPAIVRNGTTAATASISNLRIAKDTNGSLALATLNRSGDESLYGGVRLVHIDDEGNESVLSVVKGLSVYLPNASRPITVRIPSDAKVDLKKGKLRMEYQTQTDSEKERLLAQSELSLR
jgi:hypothetical protein